MTMFVFGIIVIEVWPTEFPVWGFVLALLIAFFYIIPIGMIQAITNQQVGLNVVTELVVGYAIPGRPLAMMLFKVGKLVVASGAFLTCFCRPGVTLPWLKHCSSPQTSNSATT